MEICLRVNIWGAENSKTAKAENMRIWKMCLTPYMCNCACV